MPASVLKLIQLGDENTWGTATKATAKVMGVSAADASQKDEVESVGDLGNSMPSVVGVLKKTSAEMTLTQRANYQDIVYWLHGLFGVVAGSVAANTTYAYKYTAPAATLAVVGKPYTIEIGEPAAAGYEIDGAVISELTLKGDADSGLWTVDASFLGKTLATGTMTTGLAIRAVDVCRFADTLCYIDPAAGPVGTTLVTATLISAELKVAPGRHFKFINSVAPLAYGDSRWDGSLTLVLEFNATSKAYVDALIAPAAVPKLVRLKCTQGATTALRVMQIDFSGTIVDGVKLFDDRDGNMTVSLKLNGVYSSSALMLSWLKFYIKNELSVMP